jgi:glycogen operon protein
VTERRRGARLGAVWTPEATEFSVYSEHAERIELCLFDDRTERRLTMHPHEAVWHASVDGVSLGQRYGYRAHGPYAPETGDRFNPAKLLLDPYARAIDGEIDWSGPVYGHRSSGAGAHAELPDRRNSAGRVPLGVVIDDGFDWQGDRPPDTPLDRTVIYELHVKGFSKRHSAVPEALRGTYAALAHPASLAHFQRLGVTAIELLPVQAFADDDFLVARGLRNYWGYSPLGFFAPEQRYASARDPQDQVREFKEMVRCLHASGIEVLLDVVFNHSCEGNHLGPTLSFRGLDNRTYYRLFTGQLSYYEDVSGTGNTVNAANAQTLKLILDSMRYWVEDMHVDGFRFDLAPALAREEIGFSRTAAFFRAIHQDPVLSTVKLIAEPWDIGDHGYQLGAFPRGWSEWNDRYRNAVRSYWRGDPGTLGELGFRVTGSADIFQRSHRAATSSINFVTAHDGFTMADLVSYERKHNLANGEHNRDGSDWNLSANYGVEGDTNDPAIVATRERQMRNFMATLWLSVGVPMLCAGDEMARTQRGNNNPYCQDNETSWLDWDWSDSQRDLLACTERLAAFRAAHPALQRRTFLSGHRASDSAAPDLLWQWPEGTAAPGAEWHRHDGHSIGYLLASESGEDIIFVAMNAAVASATFRMPPVPRSHRGKRWQAAFDSTHPTGDPSGTVIQRGRLSVVGRSVVAFALL